MKTASKFLFGTDNTATTAAAARADVATVRQKLRPAEFCMDVVCGGIAGVTTGAVVAIPESYKVALQIASRTERWAVAKSPKTFRAAVQNIPVFSGIFGAVCAIEFSVNRQIDHIFGSYAGIAASATTGGVLLASADHIMFIKDKAKCTTAAAFARCSKSLYTLPTGFAPMWVREAGFMISVMHLGPATGRFYRRKDAFGSKSEDFYKAAGRLTAGICMAVASQPFDSLARALQNARYYGNGADPSVIQCAKGMWASGKTFSGVVPRMVLASFGGTMAGYVFDKSCSLLKPQLSLLGAE